MISIPSLATMAFCACDRKARAFRAYVGGWTGEATNNMVADDHPRNDASVVGAEQNIDQFNNIPRVEPVLASGPSRTFLGHYSEEVIEYVRDHYISS